jgi:ABC-type uncharacterized transport system auxiliary subunit
MTRTVLLATATTLALLLGACTSFKSNEKVPQAWALRYAPLAPEVAAAGATPRVPSLAPSGAVAAQLPALQVLRPIAAPGLDDDHITLLREGQKLDFYAGARWAGPLPEVIGQVAVEALRARGAFRAVLGDGAAFAAEQSLQLEIVRCTAVYAGSGAPEVQVKLVASFGRRDDRRLLATQVLEAKAQASENRLGAVAAAYERAVNAALAQLTLPTP